MSNHIGRTSILRCWLLLIATYLFFVILDTMITDNPEGSFTIGPSAWRGPYELLIILGLYLSIGKKYSAQNLWLWLAFSSISGIFMLMDTLWFWLAQAMQIEGWTSYTIKPQDGVVIFGICVIFSLLYRLIRRGFDFIVAGHLGLLIASTVFLIFVHVVTIYGVSKPFQNKDIEGLKIKSTSVFFTSYCEEPGFGCYEGDWNEGSSYKIVLDHDLSDFVYSQFEDTPNDKKVGSKVDDNASRIGGMSEINAYAKDKPFVLHAWNTGWTDVSIIDQPEKYAVYYKNGDQVRIMVDYNTAVSNRAKVVSFMRPFLALFAVVWIITGICLIVMHSRLPRFVR